jgi:5-amino-6-(5-phosphoribosylamino)uracil reductase
VSHPRPHTTVILAMTIDGKIADKTGSAARFSSASDLTHLETQLSQTDGVIFGASTLRAYGTSLSIRQEELLQWRQQQGKPPQPVQIVYSASGNLDPGARFFRQPFPRWLLTTQEGSHLWESEKHSGFDRIIISADSEAQNLSHLYDCGLKRLAIIGGGKLIASLLAEDLIDELWLTLCPWILGGVTAPTPVGGEGFLADTAKRFQLLSSQILGEEVFLHYRCVR